MTSNNAMIPLQDHQAFEDMLRARGNRPSQHIDETAYAPWVCVWFSAKWCKPCQKLNKDVLLQKAPLIKWYSCDVDENTVSLGYAGLNGIPGFCLIKDGVFKDKKQGAQSEEEILAWLAQNGAPIPIC